MQRPSPSPRRALWGIINRKERWGLSGFGVVAAVAGLILAAGFLILAIYPFLAVTERVDTKILVVEGWVQESAIRAAVDEFKNGSYQTVFTTGGPVQGSGGYTNDYNTAASVGAGRLKRAGIAPELVQMVPSRVTARDRTYSSAVALREWFREHGVVVRGINVLTEDEHARRTRLLFEKAFGKNVKVGIIAISSPDYDAHRWWRYSEGVRETIGESIAYVYARCFFFTPEADSNGSG